MANPKKIHKKTVERHFKCIIKFEDKSVLSCAKFGLDFLFHEFLWNSSDRWAKADAQRAELPVTENGRAQKWGIFQRFRSLDPSKIEWDLTNGPLRRLLELLNTQVLGG